jgi:thymidine phosphorylase
MTLLPADTIRTKRDGGLLSTAQIQHFVQGLVNHSGKGGWSDSQAAALAMAVVLKGMTPAETVALTRAMAQSGSTLNWADTQLPGPVLDKHSTGGVGDKVSLLLAPIVAACGGVVPMVSGRGLGHTGGTLDKLEALPGYQTQASFDELLHTLRQAGCAIVGASSTLAPADQRLYAIRDVTATVESLPLITASILSKKLAAGLQGLVLDVKVGSGAFMVTLTQAQTLATSLVEVAHGAGLPARAVITDMNQVLGHTAGNALEVQETINFLRGVQQEPRLLQVTLALCAELLHLGGLFATVALAHAAAARALSSGAAAERFARMVAAQGGPADVLRHAHLPTAPVVCAVPALRSGFVTGMDVRAVGLAVVALGGGRTLPGQAVDPRVGLSQVLPLGTHVQVGAALAWVHAASADAAAVAVAAVQQAVLVGDAAVAVPAVVVSGASLTR